MIPGGLCFAGIEPSGTPPGAGIEIILMQALQSPGRLKQAADHGVLKSVNGVHDYNAVSPRTLTERLERCGKFGLDWYYVTLRPEYADRDHATLKRLLETARRYRGRTKVRWWLELTSGHEDLIRDPRQLKALVDLVGADNVVVSDNELRIDPAASGAREVCRLWYWKFRKPLPDGQPAYPEQVAVERPSMYPVHQLAVFAERYRSLGVRLNCTVASFGTWEPSRPPRAGWDNYIPMLEQDHLFNWYVLGAAGVHRIFIYSVPDAAGREYHDQTLAVALESFRTGKAPQTSAGWPPAPLFGENVAAELRAARQRVEQLEAELERARGGDLNGDGNVDRAGGRRSSRPRRRRPGDRADGRAAPGRAPGGGRFKMGAQPRDLQGRRLGRPSSSDT